MNLKEELQDVLYESNVTKPARVVVATPHNVEVCEIECERAEKAIIHLFKVWANEAIDKARMEGWDNCEDAFDFISEELEEKTK